MADPEPTPEAVVRLEKLRRLEALGVDPWGRRFDGRTPIGDIRAMPAGPFDDAVQTGPTVRAAGRVVRYRTGGKMQFLEIEDQTGRIQIMVKVDKVAPLDWQVVNLLDLGDILGVEGEFGQTRRGELTIAAHQLTFLTKSLEPHPKDVFGLGGEYALRHRYLDLLYTPDTLRRAKQRVAVMRALRHYLDGQGYLEVETPVLTSVASGAAARPFATHHNALDIPLYLRIALELPLKRLLVGGLEKVYELGRVFRNEGVSPRHNPEFTMLELYEAYGDLSTMMTLTEQVMAACVDAVAQPGAGRTLKYGEHAIDFTPPFQRANYGDLFAEHVGADLHDEAGVRGRATALKMPLNAKDGTPKAHDVLVNDLFGEHVEDKLVGPVFVCNYPASLCPLTKRVPGDPRLAERFELYVRGMELANAYTELNDPITQAATFSAQLAGQADEDSMAVMDHDFIRALRHGMPPAGGLGVGIDRLVMLLTNTQSIRDVILFPLLRPEGAQNPG